MLNFLVADPDLQIGGPPVLPDPEIRRGGGDQFGLKIMEGGGEGGRAPSLDPLLILTHLKCSAFNTLSK